MLRVILCSIIIFFAAFFVHILIWQLIKPKKQVVILFLIFILAPIIIVFLLSKVMLIDLKDIILMVLLLLSLSCAYIQTYPAIAVYAPSLFIVYLIGKHKKISLDEIKTNITEGFLVKDRLTELQNEGWIDVSKSGGKLVLKYKGKFLARMFIIYRGLLGLAEGEG